MQKGYTLYRFSFFQDWANFGRLTRPEMKTIAAQLSSVDLRFVLEKQRIQKTQFSKGIF